MGTIVVIIILLVTIDNLSHALEMVEMDDMKNTLLRDLINMDGFQWLFDQAPISYAWIRAKSMCKVLV